MYQAVQPPALSSLPGHFPLQLVESVLQPNQQHRDHHMMSVLITWGILPENLGGGVRHAFLETLALFPYSLPYFRPDPKNFPLLKSKWQKIYTLFHTSGQNIPNLRPKCSKSIPVSRPKRLKNHTLWHRTYLYMYSLYIRYM